jgi:VCBS repeat-containing protein
LTGTITVVDINDSPERNIDVPDQVNVDNDTVTPIDMSGNFSDVDSTGVFTFSAENLPAGLSIAENTGVISGTIDNSASQGGTNGVYSVTVTAMDDDGATVTDTFTWTVTNPTPTATDNVGEVTEETDLLETGNVLTDNDNAAGVNSDPDGDALSVAEVNGLSGNVGHAVTGTYGNVVINSDGSYSYTLDNTSDDVHALAIGETLSDTFEYTVSDSEGGTDTATLTITIHGTNDAPIARDDVNTTDESTAITASSADGVIQPNDSDIDGTTDNLVVAKVAGEAGNVGVEVPGSDGGVFVIHPDGSYTFDPGNDFTGLETGETKDTTVEYTIHDEHGGEATAILTVTVEGITVNRPDIDDGATITDSTQTETETGWRTQIDTGEADPLDDVGRPGGGGFGDVDQLLDMLGTTTPGGLGAETLFPQGYQESLGEHDDLHQLDWDSFLVAYRQSSGVEMERVFQQYYTPDKNAPYTLFLESEAEVNVLLKLLGLPEEH